MSERKVKITSRNDHFTSKIKSDITLEIPADDNNFLVKETRTHGYNVLDLMDDCDVNDVFFLLYNGELPNDTQKQLLRKLSIFLINLGPRHSSSRTAANAAIGRTDVNHIVPIAMMGMGGAYGGSKEIENAMRFLKKHHNDVPEAIAQHCLNATDDPTHEDWIIAPGFGTDFRGQSPFIIDAKNNLLLASPTDGYLNWANTFVSYLPADKHCGWRLAGVVAAVLLDLNIAPRLGAGIFQILASPGALAHGIHFSNQPITEIPFLKDEDYEIKNDQ
jgi:citrate synthase